MPEDGSKFMYLKSFFDLINISAEHKNNILSVLDHLNQDNSRQAAHNYNGKPFNECKLANTSMADLKVYAGIKREQLTVLSQEHRALYERAWTKARSAGVNLDSAS